MLEPLPYLLLILVVPLVYFFLFRPLRFNITKRRQAENDLKELSSLLEDVVTERTAELEKENQDLQKENTRRGQIEEALQYRFQFEEIIMNLSADIINCKLADIDQGIDKALATAGKFIEVDRAAIFFLVEEGGKTDNTHEWVAPGIEPRIKDSRWVSTLISPWLVGRIKQGEVIKLDQLADLPIAAMAEKKEFRSQGIKSLLALPLIYAGSVVGFLRFEAIRSEKHWQTESTILLKVVAEIIVNALMRKRTEENLNRSQLKLVGVFNSSPEAITVTNFKGEIVECNQAMLDLHGFESKDEIIGKNAFELIAKKDRDRAMENMNKTLKQDLIKNIEYAFLARDGREFPAELSASVMKNASGRVIGFVAITSDITERKHMEEELIKLKKAVDASGEIMFLTDREGMITYLNPEFTRVYGYSAAEVLKKTTPRIIKSGAMKPLDYEAFWKTILNKQVVKGKLINKTKDGRLINIEGSANPILGDKGEIVGFLAIQRESVEQKT